MADSSKSNSFDILLEKIRKESKGNTVELGRKFELITKKFFQTDRHWKNQFKNVWMWKESKFGKGEHDTGIDLIAQGYDGTYTSIQCKCYSDSNKIDLKSITNFDTLSNNLKIKNKILVCTHEDFTSHAGRTIKASNIRVIESSGFRDSSITDWSVYPEIKTNKPHKLWDYQKDVKKSVISGFENSDRGKMIMACGTGKTLTSLHIAEEMVGKGGTVLFLVPSISLISQSMRDWSANSRLDLKHYYLAVCSDKSVGDGGSIQELEAPVSTDSKVLSEYLEKRPRESMTVIFSTYHSIAVVQKSLKGQQIDLAICDEAHHTASSEEESYFSKIHYDKNLECVKRLYMTATPKVYTTAIKEKADYIASMDDESLFGKEFDKIKFGKAVELGKLSDFRVRIALVSEDFVDKEYQQAEFTDENLLPLGERTKYLAVWHAIRHPEQDDSTNMLQRVIIFTNRIITSKKITGGRPEIENPKESEFKQTIKEFRKSKTAKKDSSSLLDVDLRHVDGGMSASIRKEDLRWLAESELDKKTCRIISNARCFSEGVDVPALDGVVFWDARQSVTDVVQSVGRVMRSAPDKTFGYVILPVAIPAGMNVEDSLDDSRWKIVWQTINALRSHDEEFDKEINRLVLGGKSTDRIGFVTPDHPDVEGVLKDVSTKAFSKIKSKLLEKCGDRSYYPSYGKQLGKESNRIEAMIKTRAEKSEIRKIIEQFQESLKILINDSITFDNTTSMIAQHIVLGRVFNSLFSGEFTSKNTIAIEFEKIVKKINLKNELVSFEEKYLTIDREISNIETSEERQNFIRIIYENFMKGANEKDAERHGVVYTPTELIDFIIYSTEYLLHKHFGVRFDSEMVKILEPFAGTGAFITRLLESELIDNKNLYRKYTEDIYANEILLLAYYIATVNIETTYQSITKSRKYVSFEGMNYTDTLNLNPRYRLGEKDIDEYANVDYFKKDGEKIRGQKGGHLHVIMGNPPYSAGQKSFDDDNANTKYQAIDRRIKETYKEKSTASNTVSLDDSYIRSIRWASDRIGDTGIIAFVTNAGFLKSDAGSGIRACLVEEFDEVWCYDLRGNQRTMGEESRREGGQIFGSGSRTPITITFFVKKNKKTSKRNGEIFYKDIGDYLSRERKLEMVQDTKSIQDIKDWETITPDKHYDWLNQRDGKFSQHILIGSKNKVNKENSVIFKLYSDGVKTNRDVWVYNSSKNELESNMQKTIDYCNKQNLNKLKNDPTKIKTSIGLLKKLKKEKPKFDNNKIRIGLYRPFFKQYFYFDHIFNEARSLTVKLFPKNDTKSLIICIPYKYRQGKFSTFLTNITPDLEVVHHSQCFPLYVYENNKKKSNISDDTLKTYQTLYNKKITKEDIFYYVYGVLHYELYKKKYTNNLSRELPHIPMFKDFEIFSKVGRSLAKLHLNYDTGLRYSLGKPKFKPKNFVNVDDKANKDPTIIKIDGQLLYDNIPEMRYSVNGRTPIGWLKTLYRRKEDEKGSSGIVKYPCEDLDIIPLIERLVHVGIESDKLIASLPKKWDVLDWKPKKSGLDQFAEGDEFQSKL